MKLIGALTSPYVRKVRIVMTEKKLDYRLELEDVWSAETVIGDSNPLGKVPCLIMEGGEALFDSRVIVEYLDALSPVGKLIPTSGRERAEVKTWEALADGLLDASILARRKSGAGSSRVDFMPINMGPAARPVNPAASRPHWKLDIIFWSAARRR